MPSFVPIPIYDSSASLCSTRPRQSSKSGGAPKPPPAEMHTGLWQPDFAGGHQSTFTAPVHCQQEHQQYPYCCTVSGALPSPEGGAVHFPTNASSSARTIDATAVPTRSSLNVSHDSRSSISSTASHLFSPKVRADSPVTPPFTRKAKSASPHGYMSQLSVYLAEMMSYLWFSPPKLKKVVPFPRPSEAFLKFCQDTLLATQVSQSVVVLALLFVWKLQNTHCIDPMPGSEYKLTVVSLMLANKILDDHTYTNKTWSEVTGLPLPSLNEGEMEFLQGLDFNLYVSRTAYVAWLELLEKPTPGDFSTSSTSRKRVKLDRAMPALAPSAPTSPLYTGQSTQVSGYAFSPSIRHQQQQQGFFLCHMPAPSPMLAGSFQTLQVPVQAPRSQNIDPLQTGHPPPAAAKPFMYSTPSMSRGPSDHTNLRASSRKRKLSGQASLPIAASWDRRPSSAQPLSRMWDATSEHLKPQMSLSIPGPYPSMLAPYPANADSAMSVSATSMPTPADNASNQYADFSNLTSRISPINDLSDRNPSTLTYYALAAGQQRGGYLAHQPIPHVVQSSVHDSVNGTTASQTRSNHTCTSTQPSRPILGYPRHTHSNNSNALRQSQQLSCAIQPRSSVMSAAHQPHAFDQPQPHSVPLFQPASANTEYSGFDTSPTNSHYAAQANAQIGSADHVVQQAAYNIALPPTQQAASTGSSQLPYPYIPKESAPSYYSSFSNSGLPGVMRWPAQASFRYGGPEPPSIPPISTGTYWPRGSS